MKANSLKKIPCGLFAAILALGSPLATSETIFEENFDDQPDWTSTLHTVRPSQSVASGDVLPKNWDEIYQGTKWSPETGYPNKHASIEILSENANKARGGVGKSMVNWRESASEQKWNSDSQLVKKLNKDYDELYIEFWISFSDNWWQRDNVGHWASKIFRVGSWDGVGNIVSGYSGALGPIFFWDYKRDKYNLQNFTHYRGGPWGENYYMNNDEPSYPQYKTGNFGSSTLGMGKRGSDPLVVNQVEGGYLNTFGKYEQISHNQLFGASQHWTKFAFYVKMNSAPDVTDGVLMQWVNDQRILVDRNIPWIKRNKENKMVGWNYIALGGNDNFYPYPKEEQFEDWYAIDNLVVRTTIPNHNVDALPNPPGGIVIQ